MKTRYPRTVAFALLGLAASIVSCGPGGSSQRYELKGKVVLVDRKGATLSVAHDAIPGYMDAMTMPFALKDELLLNELAEGDRVSGILVVSGSRSWLEDVVWSREAALAPGSVGTGSSNQPAPGSSVPDFHLVNQDGKRISIAGYRGSALVLTFIYTRCPLPDYCPLMTTNFAEIEKTLREQLPTYPTTRLLSISVDPQYDTPKVLRAYGTAMGADFKRWEFATGDADQVKAIAEYFGLTYWAEGDQIIHGLRTAVIDEAGNLVKLFSGNEWKPDQVLAELRFMKVYHAVAVVEAVDRDAGTVQLNHQEIPGFMPAMNMPFNVKDRSILDGLAAGDNVDFRLQANESGMIVTSISKR
jgi:protein SCO1/2